jgi:hypothetical protein
LIAKYIRADIYDTSFVTWHFNTTGAAARAAGMLSLGVDWGSHSRNTLEASGSFDFIISSVANLKDALTAHLNK